ncbi:hypothetical protein [Rickettsiales endosymbiont of Stachyamoeba lipophora]|uniref:hypothetical protein n=1 Tax=Rickettsiales endosymbiont of Stachyamoeba lipophora TaxID=2486578 RepID=UPI000F654E08|nr:hypothetical protein [Rickettsiales endosymbiont of Stachyamoeba lipophora]AZL15244.1 hypothetical protein EF513_01550 [Rickettsiales endosymbiont of Stachyamoeba lipophora]
MKLGFVLLAVTIFIILVWLILKGNRNNTLLARRKTKLKKWHDQSDNSYKKPVTPEYQLIKLKNSPIKQVYNHNFHNPEANLHEYGIDDEASIVGLAEDVGHFTKLIRHQRGFLFKLLNFGSKGFWVNLVTATRSSKDINRGI